MIRARYSPIPTFEAPCLLCGAPVTSSRADRLRHPVCPDHTPEETERVPVWGMCQREED